jgi:hypothetical protein
MLDQDAAHHRRGRVSNINGLWSSLALDVAYSPMTTRREWHNANAISAASRRPAPSKTTTTHAFSEPTRYSYAKRKAHS